MVKGLKILGACSTGWGNIGIIPVHVANNKYNTKKIFKKILSDQIFQKLKLKFFVLHKTENIVLFY